MNSDGIIENTFNPSEEQEDILYEVNLVEELVLQKSDSVLSRFVIKNQSITKQHIIDLVVNKHEPLYYKGTKEHITIELEKYRNSKNIDVTRELIKAIIFVNRR